MSLLQSDLYKEFLTSGLYKSIVDKSPLVAIEVKLETLLLVFISHV